MSSDIQRLRASIEAEYHAAQIGLSGYALTSRHDFISARLGRIADYHEQLSRLVGKREVCVILSEINDRLVGTKQQGEIV